MVQERTRSLQKEQGRTRRDKIVQDDIRRHKMVQERTRSLQKEQGRTRRDKIVQEGTR